MPCSASTGSPPNGPWDDLINFIFDGGTLTPDTVSNLKITDEELRAIDFLAFFEARRTSLVARIKDKLKTQDVDSVLVTSLVTGEDIDESLAEGDVGD